MEEMEAQQWAKEEHRARMMLLLEEVQARVQERVQERAQERVQVKVR